MDLPPPPIGLDEPVRPPPRKRFCPAGPRSNVPDVITIPDILYIRSSAPAAPVAPSAPAAPVAPSAPAAPVAPVAPVAPAAPVAPVAPIAPAVPVAPIAPVAPVAPIAPAVPIAPIAPVAQKNAISNTIYVCGTTSNSVKDFSQKMSSRIKEIYAKSQTEVNIKVVACDIDSIPGGAAGSVLYMINKHNNIKLIYDWLKRTHKPKRPVAIVVYGYAQANCVNYYTELNKQLRMVAGHDADPIPILIYNTSYPSFTYPVYWGIEYNYKDYTDETRRVFELYMLMAFSGDIKSNIKGFEYTPSGGLKVVTH